MSSKTLVERQPDASRTGRLDSIDVWRGLAALAVVFFHMRHDAPGGFREHPFFFPSFLMNFGWLGVPFFVVISGFCIHRKAAIAATKTGKYRLKWGQFWRRRFWRLYPTYLAAIAFSLVCAKWFYTGAYDYKAYFKWDLLTHLLMIHNLTDEFSMKLTNGAFWSLGMEEQLYGLYFFLFLMITCYSYRTAIYLISAISVFWRLLILFISETTIDLGPFHLGTWFQWPFQYCFHWTLGAIAVDAFMGNIRLPKWCSSFSIATTFLLLGILFHNNTIELIRQTRVGAELLVGMDINPLCFKVIGQLSELLFPLSFFCFINWGLEKEKTGTWSPTVNLIFAPFGWISYSMYLIHIPVLNILESHIPFEPSPSGWIKRFLCYLPIIFATSVTFYWCVERWFLGVGKQKVPVESDSSEPVLLSPLINYGDTD